jgi:hypothetical protein
LLTPQGSGLQAEICCAEGQQQQAECGDPGGVNKMRHTNKMAQKHKTGHRKIMDSPAHLDQRVKRLSAARDLAAGSRAILS